MQGIPHLVLLDGSDGSVITLDGKKVVMQDTAGLQFPWQPRAQRIISLLVPSFVRTFVRQQVAAVKLAILLAAYKVLSPVLPRALLVKIFGADSVAIAVQHIKQQELQQQGVRR